MLKILTFLSAFVPLMCLGQTNQGSQIKETDALRFSIPHPKGKIEFIKLGLDTTIQKPTILFLQGSLPVPLVFDLETRKHIHIPFSYDSLSKHFHIIEISMPHTPLIVSIDQVNSKYCYITDTTNEHAYDTNYIRDNVLDVYVDRASSVIEFLTQKTWIDSNSIHVIGHSQGSKVGAVLASESNQIASVSLLGFNPYGRYDQFIRAERQKLQDELITPEEYLTNIDELYDRWQSICNTPNDVNLEHHTWVSFSKNYLPYLLQIDVPIFVGYGTKDIISDNCDLLPIDFISAGKSNLTVKPYFGLDHSFYQVVDGKPDHRNGAHFGDVVNDITNWIDTQ